jgi:hypothetical protein
MRLEDNTTGYYNTAVGSLIAKKYHRKRNTAVGHNSLNSNTTGIKNTAIGQDSMRSNTTGQYNTAVGHDSLTYLIPLERKYSCW